MSNKKSTIQPPSIRSDKTPDGNYPGWRYLGISSDGRIAIEIDSTSLSQVHNYSSKLDNSHHRDLSHHSCDHDNCRMGIYEFRIRRSFFSDFDFDKIYNFKQKNRRYTIEHVILNCNLVEYKLKNIVLYDQFGHQIQLNGNFNAQSIKWMIIGKDTLSWLQYLYVCKKHNNSIGY